MSAFTLPLATQQILVDGELYHEKAAPTASLGLGGPRGLWTYSKIPA